MNALLSCRAANMLRLACLEKILQACRRAEVPVALLKGAAFLDTLYPDLGERPMCDLDILVRRADKQRAASLLETLGYHPNRAPERTISDRFYYHWSFTLPLSGGGEVVVELHDAFCQRARFKVCYATVWQNLVTYTTPARHICTLSAEDTVLHLALHDGLHGFDLHQRYIEDMRRVIIEWHPHWPCVIARARAWGACANLYASLSLAARRGAPVPQAVLIALTPRRWRLFAWRCCFDFAGTGRTRATPNPKWQVLLTICTMLDRPGQVARTLGGLVGCKALDLLVGRCGSAWPWRPAWQLRRLALRTLHRARQVFTLLRRTPHH